MLCDFVRFNSQDGLELQGLFYPATSTSVVVFVHELAGNFYANRFVDYFAAELYIAGIAFFTFNNRGHDYVSDFIKTNHQNEYYVQIGAAHEVFEECIPDISAALEFVEKKGYSNIYLCGHSTGALKAAFYQSSTQDQRVKALILLSPSDDIGIQIRNLGENFYPVLKIAEDLIKEGKGRKLMPEDLFNYPLVDAKTYVATFGKESKIGLFRYNLEGFSFPELRKTNCPILVTFGTEREAVMGDIKKIPRILNNLRDYDVRITIELIQGAPHNYLRHEDELAKTVSHWIKQL